MHSRVKPLWMTPVYHQFSDLYSTFSSAALGWSGSMSLFMPESATPHQTGHHSNLEERCLFLPAPPPLLYKKRSNSIWDFRCLVTRWLLSSLIGGFGDGSFFFFFVRAINCSRTTHGEGSTLMCTTARICSVKPSDLCLAEACRECRTVGNGGKSGPGQPCRTHVWVSRHRARSVHPD